MKHIWLGSNFNFRKFSWNVITMQTASSTHMLNENALLDVMRWSSLLLITLTKTRLWGPVLAGCILRLSFDITWRYITSHYLYYIIHYIAQSYNVKPYSCRRWQELIWRHFSRSPCKPCKCQMIQAGKICQEDVNSWILAGYSATVCYVNAKT